MLRSQAHLQVAQADTRPKPAKELTYSNTLTEKYAAKMKDRITNDKFNMKVQFDSNPRTDKNRQCLIE